MFAVTQRRRRATKPATPVACPAGASTMAGAPARACAASQAQLLSKQLGDRSDVASVAIKTPQQGLDELAKLQGFSGALDALEQNPLPFVLMVQPKPGADAATVARLIGDLREMHSVAQ